MRNEGDLGPGKFIPELKQPSASGVDHSLSKMSLKEKLG